MLDDVGDLLGVEAEVDGDEDAAVAADAEERDQEAARVRADDGHPLPVADAHGVEGQGHAPGPRVQLGVGDRPERTGHVGLVHHGHPVPVDQRGPVEEVGHRQRNTHAPPDLVSLPVAPGSRTPPARRTLMGPARPALARERLPRTEARGSRLSNMSPGHPDGTYFFSPTNLRRHRPQCTRRGRGATNWRGPPCCRSGEQTPDVTGPAASRSR